MAQFNRLAKAVKFAALSAAGATTLLATPVFAQDEEDASIEEVVVTGSRIQSPTGFGQVSPVTVVSADAIKNTGITRIEDVLNRLPQVEPAENAFLSNGSTGTATLDLRGMGAERTLVLINGRRMPAGGLYSLVPDVNSIPSSMVERVDVLTGGASATYGADAVAGVVNFVMKDVEGVEISGTWSAYQHDNDNGYIQGLMDDAGYDYPSGSEGPDGDTYSLDFIAGNSFADDKGHATVYASYQENEELLQGSRDYSSCALSDDGTSCGGSANAVVPNFFIAPVTATGEGPGGYDYDQEGFYTLQPDSSLADYDGTNIYNFAPVNYFFRPSEKYHLGAFLDYEINEHAKPYVELAYTSSKTESQIAESGTFFADAYILPVDNALFPQAFQDSLAALYPDAEEVGVYIGKRNVEGGARSELFELNSYRMVLGSEGAINDKWSYDAYYLRTSTAARSAYINDFFGPKIAVAVDAEACAADDSCVPYEVFTYNGVTPEMANGLTGTAAQVGRATTDVLSASVSGELFQLPTASYPMQLAAGYEHRSEHFEQITDTVFAEGQLLGQGGETPSLEGGYHVTEFFLELNAPVINDAPGIEALTLDLAYRYSDYDLGFQTDTYRFGIDWQIIDQVRLRTGYNRAVRAPNVEELFSVQSLGLWSGADPCAGDTPSLSAAQCANTGLTTAQYGNIVASPASQYNQITGGNPGVEPEVSDSYTFGFVFAPMDGMDFSIDYWKIEIEDAIGDIGASTILNLCAINGQLCDQVVRAPNGSLWQGDAGYILNTELNLGEETYAGVDVAFRYQFDALGGLMDVSLTGTYYMDKETVSIPSQPETAYDCVGALSDAYDCFATPEWRHNLTLSYQSDSFWGVTATWRYIGDVAYDGEEDLIADGNMDAINYLDLSAQFSFFDNSDINFGINNIFDEEPPLVGGTLADNANTIPGYWDALGRYIFTRVTFRF